MVNEDLRFCRQCILDCWAGPLNPCVPLRVDIPAALSKSLINASTGQPIALTYEPHSGQECFRNRYGNKGEQVGIVRMFVDLK